MSKTIYIKRHERLCEVLRTTRKANGVTQQKLANKLRKPQSYVAKVELGERRLDVMEFVAWCQGIGADPRELIGELLANL